MSIKRTKKKLNDKNKNFNVFAPNITTIRLIRGMGDNP